LNIEGDADIGCITTGNRGEVTKAVINVASLTGAEILIVGATTGNTSTDGGPNAIFGDITVNVAQSDVIGKMILGGSIWTNSHFNPWAPERCDSLSDADITINAPGYTILSYDQDGSGVDVARDYTVGAGKTWTIGAETTLEVVSGATLTIDGSVISTISFDSDGGSDVPSITAGCGSAVEAPAAPTKDGCIFAGWYAEGSETLFAFDTMPLNGASLTAKWVDVSEEVSVQADDDKVMIGIPEDCDVVQLEMIFEDDAKVTIEEDSIGSVAGGLLEVSLSKSGEGEIFELTMTLGGEEASGFGIRVTLPYAGDSTPVVYYMAEGGVMEEMETIGIDEVSKTITFATSHNSEYGIEYPHSITWSVNGTETTTWVLDGEMPDYGSTPSKTGYEFAGWSPAVTEATADATYTAVFTPVPSGPSEPAVTVTYMANGGSFSGSQSLTVGSTAVQFDQVPVRGGYAFLGWALASLASTPVYAEGASGQTVSSGTTLYAVWELIVEDPADPGTPETPSGTSDDSVYLVIGCAVAVIALLAAVSLLLFRKL